MATPAGMSASTSGARTIGPTYPIAEPDMAAELRDHAKAVDWQKWLSADPKKSAAMQSADLPRATRDQSTLFDPSYALPQALLDRDGKVLYPAGYRINVYDRIKMPGRIIVIQGRPADYTWLDRVARPGPADKVLLASGNVFEQRQATHRRLFLLDRRFIERFGLHAVPCIVTQQGNQLRITDYAIP